MNRARLALATIAVFVSVASAAMGQGRPGTAGDSTALVQLNRGYVNAFVASDAAWYDAHLAADYECLCSRGTVVSRADFVRGAKQPMTYRSFTLDSVRVKLLGDVALITAITPYVRADGTTGASRYTDTWVRRGGEWKTLQAQITPIVP